MILWGADPIGGDQARRAAREELSRPEYHHGGTSLPERIAHWIGRRLGDLFTGAGGAASHALLILLVVLLVVAVFFAVRAGVPHRSRTRTESAADPLAPAGARDHRRIAERLTAEGRHAEALREWLRAAVATIEERGVLPPRPGRTGAATAREAGPLLPSAADPLRAATATFDEVWYGGRPATPADVTLARAAADAVRSARVVEVAR